MSKTDAQTELLPRLRFPEFRDAQPWTARTLDEYCERLTETVGDAELTPVSISSGVGFVAQAEKFGRDISGAQYARYIFIKRGDFAYNRGNSKRFPQGCVYRLTEFDEAAASNAFYCFRLHDGWEPTFFEGLFESNCHGRQLIKDITSSARSTGLLNIRADTFFGITIPMPPTKAEHRKIAACLGSLDDLIAAEGRKLAALRGHKKGLMQQLFPREGETRPRLRFVEFRNDPEWQTKPLVEVAKYENGKAYEKHIAQDGKYVVVNSRFISTDGRVRKYSDEEFCIATADDILMVLSDLPNGRALAKCFLVDEDHKYAVNQRICRLTPTDVRSDFFYYLLNRHWWLLAFDDGLNQTHLSKGSVLDCPLAIPSLKSEQQRIANCLASLDVMIAGQAAKLDALRAHKRGLMQQLFPDTESI